jgi:two-component system, sensor histidine kinase and response regulator
MQYTILVVDDEPANLRMLERLLRKDYCVMSATSGEEALTILTQKNVDLIITDQRMPGMSGTDLLRESMQTNPDATRIILTGFTDLDALIEAINTSRVYKYVSKPWDPINLKSIIDQALYDHQKQVDMKEFVNDMAKLMYSHPSLFTDQSNHSSEPLGKSVSSVHQ